MLELSDEKPGSLRHLDVDSVTSQFIQGCDQIVLPRLPRLIPQNRDPVVAMPAHRLVRAVLLRCPQRVREDRVDGHILERAHEFLKALVTADELDRETHLVERRSETSRSFFPLAFLDPELDD